MVSIAKITRMFPLVSSSMALFVMVIIVLYFKFCVCLLCRKQHHETSSTSTGSTAANTTKQTTTSTTTAFSNLGTNEKATTSLVVSNAHGARSKDYTRDDSAIEAQLRWLSTAAGQLYLNELSTAARTMYSGQSLSSALPIISIQFYAIFH